MFSKVFLSVGVGIIASTAIADNNLAPISFFPAPTSFVCTENPDGSWDIENIHYDAVPSLLPVDVSISAPIDIGTFSVSPGSAATLVIEFDFSNTIDLMTGEPYIQSIDEIKSLIPGGREVWLRDLEVAGDVGSIHDVHDLLNLTVGGDLGEAILTFSTRDPRGEGIGGNIFNVIVNGDVNGDIFAAGAPTNSVTLLSQGAVNNLRFLGAWTAF